MRGDAKSRDIATSPRFAATGPITIMDSTYTRRLFPADRLMVGRRTGFCVSTRGSNMFYLYTLLKVMASFGEQCMKNDGVPDILSNNTVNISGYRNQS